MTALDTSKSSALPPRPTLDPYLALAAAGITWITSAYRVSPSSQWNGDYRLVQSLSGQAIGWDGLLATVLARAIRVVPIGTEVTRLSLISAGAAALSCFFCYRICYRILAYFGHGTAVSWLSFGTATLFGVSTTTQLAATLPPGPLVALTTLLCVFDLALAAFQPITDVNRTRAIFFGMGLLVAMTFLEQSSIGVFSVVVLCSMAWATHPLFVSRVPRESLLGLLTGLLALGFSWYVTRRTAVSQAIASSIDRPLNAYGWLTLTPKFPSNLNDDLGLVVLFLSFVGAIVVLTCRERRYLSWIFVIALPQFFLAPEASQLTIVNCVRLVGNIGLLLLSAIGLLKAVQWSGRARKSPFLLAQCVAVVIQITLVLAHADAAAYHTEWYRSLGMEVFTDEAIAALPPRSVLLLRDARLFQRVLAAQMSEGLRPDILLVPLETATHEAVISELLSREPTLAAVLRELAINGNPSEFSLSTLADERPVYLEFDVEWDRRLMEHLLPLPFLSRLFSQALGRSDRAAVLQSSERQLTHAFTATTLPDSNEFEPNVVSPMEHVTRAILDRRVEEQLTLLLGMGDRQVFKALFAIYEKFEPNSDWAKRLRPRLRQSDKSIDAFDLLGTNAPIKSTKPPVAIR